MLRPTDAAARSRAMNYGCWYAIVRSEKTHTLARNEFQVLMCHHAVRKDTHAGLACNECFGMQWITAPQRMLRHAMNYWPATNSKCWCAIMRSEKTHTLACNECFGMQWITDAALNPWVLPDNKRICMRTCSSMDFETTIRLHKLSGFGKPPSLCVNPGYLSKPYKNFGFGYVGYLVCLSVYLSIYLSMSLPIYFSICLGV